MADNDKTFKDILESINNYIENNREHLNDPTDKQLAQFRKSYFYNNWLTRFRRIAAFTPLGTRGVIAIPNTTFEEWLWWFQEWARAYEKDYNEFKKLVYEALLLHEKHLELHDQQIKELNDKVNDIYNKINQINQQITEINKHLGDLDNSVTNINKHLGDIDNSINTINNNINALQKNMFNVSYTNASQGTLKNGWYMKDDHDRAFAFWWGWNNEHDHSQGVHWIPLINYIYKDNVTMADLSGSAEIGTLPIPPEILAEGYNVGVSWIYSGYVVRTNEIIGSPFFKVENVGNNTLSVKILDVTRSENPTGNLGTAQLNAGATPSLYINK